jgi:hypothetical protein
MICNGKKRPSPHTDTYESSVSDQSAVYHNKRLKHCPSPNSFFESAYYSLPREHGRVCPFPDDQGLGKNGDISPNHVSQTGISVGKAPDSYVLENNGVKELSLNTPTVWNAVTDDNGKSDIFELLLQILEKEPDTHSREKPSSSQKQSAQHPWSAGCLTLEYP